MRPSFKRERNIISFLRQRNVITQENIPLLQLLDAIRYIKKIPDTTIAEACQRLIIMVGELSESEEKTMVRLSQKYPPSTRALLGAILEQLGRETYTKALKKTLNPITKYKLQNVGNILSTSENWNIV